MGGNGRRPLELSEGVAGLESWLGKRLANWLPHYIFGFCTLL